jgi:hypothetical protein
MNLSIHTECGDVICPFVIIQKAYGEDSKKPDRLREDYHCTDSIGTKNKFRHAQTGVTLHHTKPQGNRQWKIPLY